MKTDDSGKKKKIPDISLDAGQKDHFFIKTDVKGKLVRVNFSEIKFMEANGNYSNIVTDDKIYVVSPKLRVLEETFSGSKFIKIHKSYMVNYEKITEFNKDTIILKDHTSLKVGPTYKDALIGILMGV